MKTSLLLFVLLSYLAGNTAVAAAFDSGSDGSDGELNIMEGQGPVVFNPDAYDPPLDADRDGIYHFTNIIIGSGTTLHVRADVLGHKPLIWLASGYISIEGELMGGALDQVPGVGGFWGGFADGIVHGQGPGGSNASSDGFAVPFASGSYVNPYLLPLVGGSGQGADTSSGIDGAAGGGAILLASSRIIDISGAIFLFGEAPGSRGNLRLVANTITISGNVYGANMLRAEAYEHNSTLMETDAETVIRTRPGALFPTSPIEIMTVNQMPVDHSRPGANKGVPDATINNGSEVEIMVICTGIPLGTQIKVLGWNDTVGEVLAVTNGLQGSVESSYATCTMVVPAGDTTFMARAVLP